MRFYATFLAIVACAPTPDVLPGDRVAPPSTLNVSPLLSGLDTTMVVEGAPPFADITYLLSTRGMGSEPCHPNGICGDLAPRVIFVGGRTADAFGNASLTRRVPPTFDDHIVTFQAYVSGSGVTEMTTVVQRLIGDEDLDMVYDARDNCTDLANPAQTDDDNDGFGAACDCDDNNPFANPTQSDPTADGVDQNCDGVDGPPATYPGVYQGDFTYTTDVFGLSAICVGTIDVVYDPLASPPLQGTAVCTANAPFGPITQDFEILAEVDAQGIVNGTFDDYVASVLPWTGQFSTTLGVSELTGTSAGALTIGTYTMDLVATAP